MNRDEYKLSVIRASSLIEGLLQELDDTESEFSEGITASTGSDLESHLFRAKNHLKVIEWLLEACPKRAPDGVSWEYPSDSKGAKLLNTPEEIRRLLADCDDGY